jgi:N-hydroxyarylamine O-acetyltransferase
MDIKRCLQRLDYVGPRDPSLRTLRSLQLAFLLHVPFENLDILLGREIVLSSRAVFEKIVDGERGGVCYELNILFFDLLTALGFRVDYASARMIKKSGIGPEFDHMVLIVKLEHDYLVDVGHGHFCRDPLRIDGESMSSAGGYEYRVDRYGNDYALYSRHANAPWSPRFIFSRSPHHCFEFEPMNLFHQTSPDSPFTRRRLVALATDDGHLSAIDRRLIIISRKGKKRIELDSEEAYQTCLKRYFGIKTRG